MKPTITITLEEYNSLKEVQKFYDAEENAIRLTICKSSSEHKEYKLVTESKAIVILQKELIEMQKQIMNVEREKCLILELNRKTSWF
jgi:hypothetical protein